MNTRKLVRDSDKYTSTVQLEFPNLNTDLEIASPVKGYLSIELEDTAPHPVDFEIRDEEGSANASYVDFETREWRVSDSDVYPIKIGFVTNPASSRGSKWYAFKTANWNNTDKVERPENPEFVKHHLPSIPSAQKIRLIYRMISDQEYSESFDKLSRVYADDVTERARSFSDDLKCLGFREKVEIQNFLLGIDGISRNKQDTINKIANQITEDEFQHRWDSLDDIDEMIKYVNKQPNFPDITTHDVFTKVVDRVDEKQELDRIKKQLKIDDWSSVIEL
jgi:hypothetical protein